MKIAISSSGRNKSDSMDTRFGRCNFYQIYDTNSKEVYYVENKGQFSSQGAGIQAAQQIINEGVQAVITGSVGPNAYQVLNASDIKMYKADIKSVSDLISDYETGKLTEIGSAGAAHQGMGMGGRNRGGK